MRTHNPESRSWATFYSVVDGTAIITGVRYDGTLTDAAGRPLDDESGIDTAAGLLDGTIGTASIHRVGAFVRRHLRHGQNGRMDYVYVKRMDARNIQPFRAFLPENAVAKGLKPADAKRIIAAVKSRYGF